MQTFNENNWIKGVKKVTFADMQPASPFFEQEFSYTVNSMDELEARFGKGTAINGMVKILQVEAA